MSDKGRFEAWAKTAGFDLYKYSDATGDMAGKYSCPKTRIAWETWQAAQATPPASVEPVAWMHVMDNTEGIEGREPDRVLSFNPKHPFRIAGVNFSETFPVTSTPLYTTPPAEPTPEMIEAGNAARIKAGNDWCEAIENARPGDPVVEHYQATIPAIYRAMRDFEMTERTKQEPNNPEIPAASLDATTTQQPTESK